MVPGTRIHVTIGESVYAGDAQAVLRECYALFGGVTQDTLRRYGVTDQDTRADLLTLKAEIEARVHPFTEPKPATRVSP